jgi:hypothetical protein
MQRILSSLDEVSNIKALSYIYDIILYDKWNNLHIIPDLLRSKMQQIDITDDKYILFRSDKLDLPKEIYAKIMRKLQLNDIDIFINSKKSNSEIISRFDKTSPTIDDDLKFIYLFAYRNGYARQTENDLIPPKYAVSATIKYGTFYLVDRSNNDIIAICMIKFHGPYAEIVEIISSKDGNYGRIMMEIIEKYIKSIGKEYIILCALNSAYGFYEKLGYRSVSDQDPDYIKAILKKIYKEDNIKNIRLKIPKFRTTPSKVERGLGSANNRCLYMIKKF